MDIYGRDAIGSRDDERRIVLRPLLECSNARPEDDWTGISDQKRRKKLQNRLNQRKLRQRKKSVATTTSFTTVEVHIDEKGTQESPKQTQMTWCGKGSTGIKQDVAQKPPTEIQTISESNEFAEIEQVHILDVDSEHTIAVMQRLEKLAYQFYQLGSPRTDLLLHYIQFNFSRALMENTKILGLTSDKLHDDALSPFNLPGPWQQCESAALSNLPISLQPTVVQKTIEHHPWLDLLPDAQMRDNLIRAGESYDDNQLCHDMIGRNSVKTGRTGVIVWQSSWDPSGWETTEGFAREWGWVIRDCKDLFRSTNYWRARRGEKPLFRIPKES